MKISSIEIKNIKKIKNAVIKIDKALTLFLGEIKQGKTTILDAFMLCCGGNTPTDLLTHGTDDGYIKITLSPVGYIKRSFFRDKNGNTAAKPKIEYVDINGEIVTQPAVALKKLLNPFLLDQNFFINMTSLKKKQYFSDLFNTGDVDSMKSRINALHEKAQTLRKTISIYGDDPIAIVEKPHTDELKAQLEEKTKLIKAENEKIKEKNAVILEKNLKHKRSLIRITDIDAEISTLLADKATLIDYCSKNPLEELTPDIDTSEIEALKQEIADSRVQDEKYKQYQDLLKKEKEKNDHLKELSDITSDEYKLKNENLKRLAEISETCGVKGLKFNDDGDAIYEDTAMDLLSKSQEMQLSSKLQALYPNEFGLELIDGAESLGTSVYEIIDTAIAEKKTVLATIVSDKIAVSDDRIGVWIVEDGVVEKKQ